MTAEDDAETEPTETLIASVAVEFTGNAAGSAGANTAYVDQVTITR